MKAMLKEFRIYYESLEQAENYFKPLLENAVSQKELNAVIKLVKLKGNASYYSEKIAPLVFWKDPDILLTVITEEEEIPKDLNFDCEKKYDKWVGTPSSEPLHRKNVYKKNDRIKVCKNCKGGFFNNGTHPNFAGFCSPICQKENRKLQRVKL